MKVIILGLLVDTDHFLSITSISPIQEGFEGCYEFTIKQIDGHKITIELDAANDPSLVNPEYSYPVRRMSLKNLPPPLCDYDKFTLSKISKLREDIITAWNGSPSQIPSFDFKD